MGSRVSLGPPKWFRRLEPLRVPAPSKLLQTPSLAPFLGFPPCLFFLSSSSLYFLPSFLPLFLSFFPFSPPPTSSILSLPSSFLPFFFALMAGTPYSLLSIYLIPILTTPGYTIFFHLEITVTSDPLVSVVSQLVPLGKPFNPCGLIVSISRMSGVRGEGCDLGGRWIWFRQ